MTTLGELFGAALIVPGAIDPARAAAVRERWMPQLSRYTRLDRASYESVDNPDEPALVALMLRAAERATGRKLACETTRLLHLAPGDYVLAHHDPLYEGNPVEVTIDLSPAAVEDAEIHYRRSGQVFFRVPCVPSMLAIVERGVTITCNHCYVSKLHERASVVRFIILLRDSA
ncbi:MAG TPA: hypothetical protein VIV11_17410 [Kofleriaceae bacterium]